LPVHARFPHRISHFAAVAAVALAGGGLVWILVVSTPNLLRQLSLRQTRDCSYVAGASGALPRAPVSSLRDVIPSFGNSRYRCDPTVRGER